MTTTLNFDKLKSLDPKVKYGFVKELLKTGADKPELLYQHLDTLIGLTKNNNNILKWTGIDLIGYLSAVDKENIVDKQIPALKKFLHGGHLITSSHAIFALGLIAQNKPHHRKNIIAELLLIEKDNFDTEDCKDIATGKVLETFKSFLSDIKGDKDTLGFIQQAEKCKRPATKKKAIQLLNKLQKI